MANEREVFITKYALTQGIFPCNVRDVQDKMVESTEPGPVSLYFHKPDWYDTEGEAKERAEVMKQKKMTSLRKQLDKLAALSF
tara:strand:+ start:858 stop:1106 length:249 start_codon:yes stop_codon:yes gene_type:complete